VLFTGLTVAVCLAGVTVFPDAFLRSMGLAGAGALIATAGLLVLLVAPALHMRLSNSDARALPTSTQTRRLYDAMAAHYPELVGPPPIVIVGIDLTIPVLIAAIAFGLSLDYEVFLLSRIREQWLRGSSAERAVAEGLQRTGRIVTSAALLLVVVFAGFLVGGFVPIKELGLGLVVAVALDATVVRMLLVPATMTLARTYNWWAPRPLKRLVPVVND
jgi:uncharacterized membrane protein YdfJ with MMPL/SSD domain